MQKDGLKATSNLCENYEGAGEFNKRVAWATAKIDNTHFKNEHTYSFDKFSTVLQDNFTILNSNGESHSENQMVRKMLENIKVPINYEMDSCKRILLDMQGYNFVNAVAYLSGQVTNIFTNAKIEN